MEDTGLRLCGMAEDPPRPGTYGSATSPTSVEARLATSVAILASVPTSCANQHPASAMRARRTCQAIGPDAKPSSRANASSTAGPFSPSPARVPTGPARDAASTRLRTPGSVSATSARPASQTAALKPKLSGAACWP